MRKRWIVLLISLLIIIILSLAVLSASNPVFRSTKIWSSEAAGEHIFFISSVEIAATEIRFETVLQLSLAKMIIEAQSTPQASLQNLENSYQYLTIGKFGISDGDISNVLIKFRVDKNWVSNNSDYSLVNLYYYENGWNKLKTTYLFDDSTYYYYEAHSPKLTYFAIRGEKKDTALKQVIKQTDKTNNSTVNTSFAAENSDSSAVNKNSLLSLFFSEKRNTYIFISLLLGVFLIIIILSVFANTALKGGYYENTDEIHKLIEEELAEGVPKKDIEKEIISKGWPKSLVDKIVHSEKLPHVVEIKLKSYIQSNRNKMFSDADIKKSLLKEGWPQETIDEFINEFNA